MKENNFGEEDMSNSSLSDSSSTPDSPPPPPPLQTPGEVEMELEIPMTHPSKWNVSNLCNIAVKRLLFYYNTMRHIVITSK
jgi:hypothetical protein